MTHESCAPFPTPPPCLNELLLQGVLSDTHLLVQMVASCICFFVGLVVRDWRVQFTTLASFSQALYHRGRMAVYRLTAGSLYFHFGRKCEVILPVVDVSVPWSTCDGAEQGHTWCIPTPCTSH